MPLVLGRVIIWAAYDVEISKMRDPNIVARIKSFVPATESTIKLSALNPVTKVALVVVDNEGNLLIDELAQENNDNVNSRISGSYNQTSVMIKQTWYLVQQYIFIFLLTYHFNTSLIRELPHQNEDLKAELQSFKLG